MTGRTPKHEEAAAINLARQIARRGGTAEVLHIADDQTVTTLGTFEPTDEDED